MDRQIQIAALKVQFEELIGDPASQAERILRFVNRNLDLEAMIRAVDPSLHHHHS